MFRLRTCVRDLIAMPSRPSISDSCSLLEAGMQSPWDTYLVQLVRIQQLASTIDATLYQDLRKSETQVSHALLMATSHLEHEIQNLGVTLHQEAQLQGRITQKLHFDP